MKYIKGIVMAVVLLWTAMVSQAQQVSPVDFMRMNPYQMNANPATDLPYQSVMSLFVGNIDLTLYNSTLRYDNLFSFDAQGKPATINLRKFADGLSAKNYLGFNLNENLFTLYRRINFGMLTFGYNVRAQSDFTFNDGLFKLAAYGNSAFVGESHPAELHLNLNTQVFQEFAVGYQCNITDQISVGGRAKLLFGFADVNTSVFDARLYTDPESYALRLEENISMKASMPNVITLNDGQIGTNGRFGLGDLFRNPGFAVDLAAEYRFDDHFSAMAGVRDLGFIRWGGNNLQVKGQVNDMGQFYHEGDFLFDGLDIDQLQLIISDVSYRELFLDTLKQYFQLDFSPAERYTTMLNTNLLLRGNYDIDGHNRFSVQLQGVFLRNGFRPAATLAYSGSFFKMLDVCATYTVMPDSYDNLGLGLAGNFDTFHIYLTTNNFLALFMPMNTSSMNVQAGIVFNLRLPEKNTIDEPRNLEY